MLIPSKYKRTCFGVAVELKQLSKRSVPSSFERLERIETMSAFGFIH
jgi:hypothetical protein